MSRLPDKYNGIIAVHKPEGITSHDTVDRIRKIIGQRRVGHTGTLDLLAEGVMVICLGRATKVAQFLSDLDKVYEAEITFGTASTTYDREGVPEGFEPQKINGLNQSLIMEILDKQTGVITQEVPAYSAVRVNGERLYKLARKGEEVDLPSREVEIKAIDNISFDNPALKIRVRCTKGTYIRSLAHNIGQMSGFGAYLARLARVAVGNLTANDVLTLEEVEKYHLENRLQNDFVPYAKLLNYSAITVNDGFEEQIITGKDLKYDDIVTTQGSFKPGDKISLKNKNGKILAVGTAEISSVAIAEMIDNQKLFNYIRVLN